MLCSLIHAVSVSRNRSSHLSVDAISSPSLLQPNCSANVSKYITWLISSDEGFLLTVTECHAFDAAAVSACQCHLGPYQHFLLQHSVRVDCRASRCGDRVAFQYLRGQVMTSIDTAGSPIAESEISAALVSLREHFEAVRYDAIQRVRGRLGNLSADQENAIDSLSHGIIEKVLEAPMAMLENASAANQTVFVLETVRRIFNLRT
jgi:hypothetical protein